MSKVICLVITLLLSKTILYAQQGDQLPPIFLLTEKDKVYIFLGEVPDLTKSFKVYKKINKDWQLLTPNPIMAIQDPLEFRNAIGEALYDWLKKTTKGEDEFQVLRRILRDDFLIIALPLVNLTLAEALGRLYIDRDVTFNQKYTYKIVFLDLFEREIKEFVKSIVVKEAAIPKPPFEATGDGGDGEVKVIWKYHKPPIHYEYTAVGFNIYRKEEKEKEFIRVNKVLLLWQEDNTFWLDSNVENGKKYQYYITAVDMIGKESAPSNYTQLIQPKDMTPPFIPEGVVTKGEKNKIVIIWKMNLDLDLKGYNIYRGERLQGEEFKKLNEELIPGDFSYYEDTEITPGKTYFYRISAVDISLNESKQTPGYSAMCEDTTPPGAPKDLEFKYDLKKHLVKLSWTGPKDEDLLGFYVYRGINTQTATRITSHSIKETEYIDEGYHKRWLIPGKSYFWGVSSLDNSYNESPKVWIKGEIIDDEPPLAPKSIYVHSLQDGKINVKWQISLSSDVVGYRVYRGETDKGVLIKTLGTETLSFIDEEVKKGKRYFYQISAVDSAGNESNLTDKFYITAADIFFPPPPKNVIAQYIEEKEYVLVTWDKVEVDDLAGYEIYTCLFPTGKYKKIHEKLITEEKFIHKEETKGLYYKVKAVDTSGNSSQYSEFTKCIKIKKE